MTTQEKSQKLQLPSDLPKCGCFAEGGPLFAMGRAADVAREANAMGSAFHTAAENIDLCPGAMTYLLELSIICIAGYIARAQGPALEYGSKEIEWESERLLAGLEARVLARSRDTYARGRELGLTEETVRAMRERDQQGEQS